MNTSLSWIKAYVPDLDVTAQEYTDAMTLSGTKVEGYEQLDADLEKIVVGQIDKIEKHPDADKLIVCQVNIGNESVQIVTGADNVHEGDKVPVVLDGGRVAGGHVTVRTKLFDGAHHTAAFHSAKFALLNLDSASHTASRLVTACHTSAVQYNRNLFSLMYVVSARIASLVSNGASFYNS